MGFIRAVRLANMLIERYDKRLADRLTNYNVSVQYIRRRCAFCQCVLPEENNAALSLTLTDTEKRISATGTGDGVPVQCINCMDLCYCDTDCQMSDSPRHRHYCLPRGVAFWSQEVSTMFGASIPEHHS